MIYSGSLVLFLSYDLCLTMLSLKQCQDVGKIDFLL